MLKILDIQKSFGNKHVLKGLNLEIKAGEICAVIGPNGAGKSTLSFLIAGLNKPDSGKIILDGKLGFATQDIGLYETLSGRDNLLFFGRLSGLTKSTMKNKLDELIEIFDLKGFIHERVSILSGGQKRRLHASIAFLNSPDFVILDEPTVGADIEARKNLISAIKNYASQGISIMYTTHYLPEVEALNASIAILEDGKISYRDTLEATVQNHARGKSVIELEGDKIVSYSNNIAEELAISVQNLLKQGKKITSINTVPPTLESAYLSITGHEIEGDDK